MNQTGRRVRGRRQRAGGRGSRHGAVAGGQAAARGALPIALECIYIKTVELVRQNGKATTASIIIGEVVNVHIDDEVIVDGLIDLCAHPADRPPRLHGLLRRRRHFHHAAGVRNAGDHVSRAKRSTAWCCAADPGPRSLLAAAPGPARCGCEFRGEAVNRDPASAVQRKRCTARGDAGTDCASLALSPAATPAARNVRACARNSRRRSRDSSRSGRSFPSCGRNRRRPAWSMPSRLRRSRSAPCRLVR